MPTALKPAREITDRAKRYRAHAEGVRPGPPKQCGYCGSKKNVVPDHINGREEDLEPQNLMWLCKACNTSKGILFRNHGIGRLTEQFNPAKYSRKALMEEYGQAIKVMRGQFAGDIRKAVATIRATPADIRSAYTRRTWPTRRYLYGDSGRGNPAVSRAQYGLAQAVLSARARSPMPRDVAQEIVDRTPANLRSEYSKNPAGFLADALGYQLTGSAVSGAGRTADRLTRQIMGRQRNSGHAAERTYEEFHGREADVDTVITEDIHEHRTLAGIGELCWLVIRCEDEDGEYDVTVDDFGGALLSMGEQMEHCPQLFIEGGNQGVDLKQFGVAAPLHELETLGRVVCLAYYTDKDHLGDEGGEAEYVHAIEAPLDEDEYEEWGGDEVFSSFEELEAETEGNVGPDAIYETRNKKLMLSGGSYTLKAEGIDG